MPKQSTVYKPSAVRLMALLGELREALADVGPDLLPAETEALTMHAQALAWSMDGTAARVARRRRLLAQHSAQVYDLGTYKAFRASEPETAAQMGLFGGRRRGPE